jgi:hypothetical protein
MTLFFYAETGRTITSDETKDRFGTEEAIPALGIHPLTYQPEFIPFAFNPLANGSYLPVEGNIQEQIKILIRKGYTEAEATTLLEE